MKRSEINTAIAKAKERLDEYRITLPMFGYWTVEDWKANAGAIGRIRERMLGWDVTDFGSDDFHHCGATLFTVRNGDKHDADQRAPYAEKYIILEDETEQEIPFHYHMDKTEDIINRGGGVMIVELYYKAAGGGLDRETPVTVYMDGVAHTVRPGEKIVVTPGNSITLEPYMYHRFYAEAGKGLLIVGEVSKVNDDTCDNVFLAESARFCPIEEDEPILHPLVNEYDAVL
ncbi:MAG: D-lyxose/D-mannose family sugar isomerase [Ruminococcaceae bacterium]|nr:D-lyxose/D-mannose family sugar isomerase [Oscillospiraceae bacterium]